ncbi:F-box protein [Pyrus ussuriensis x Pyrus communis]|uniref:F-box protein n=1 Tax=Pyrus ussuriensis x Pyrus communis TaxID=2448454 RepID=A0A5N5FUC7_9ROSA|nr:F-box protein [Pyrus ussuriensis x Pyrus communis]
MESSDGPELPSQVTCFEILPRLPSKSLMRFRCVNLGCNKHTHLLLTASDKTTKQQHFFSLQINQQGSRTPAAHLLTLQTPPTENERLYTAQCMNGLACLYLSNTSAPKQTDPNHPVRIFNPCTRESISLPHTSPASCTAHVTHHFGYSPLTNEYKVLQVQKLIPAVGDVHFMFKVFKMGASLWRHIEVDLNDISFDPLNFPLHRRSVCVNGAIHWMHGTHNPIVVFNNEDEKFRVIPLPEDYTCFTHLISYPVGNIVGVGGYLGLIESRYAVPFYTIHTDELLLQSSGLSRQNPACMKVILYNMKNESLRRSDIVFPDKWAYLTRTRFKLLTSYEESIEPLIR